MTKKLYICVDKICLYKINVVKLVPRYKKINMNIIIYTIL